MKYYIVIEGKSRTVFNCVHDANKLMGKIIDKGGIATIEVEEIYE